MFETGDHLSQAEFHERYERMPEHIKADLLGVVHASLPALPRLCLKTRSYARQSVVFVRGRAIAATLIPTFQTKPSI